MTTESRNISQNYGAKGYDKDGLPRQRILGQTAKAWDTAFKLSDVIWHLSRAW